MFDGLIDLLMQWVEQAFCWLLQTLVGLAVTLQHIYAAVMPAVGVPAALRTTAVSSIQIELFCFFFPAGFIVSMLIIYLTVEFTMVILIPLFRSFYDLL